MIKYLDKPISDSEGYFGADVDIFGVLKVEKEYFLYCKISSVDETETCLYKYEYNSNRKRKHSELIHDMLDLSYISLEEEYLNILNSFIKENYEQ